MASSNGYFDRHSTCWIVLLFWITFAARGWCAVPCGLPGKPASGSSDQTPNRKYNVNDEVNYWCASGYTLFGAASRQCQDNGTWTGSVPICEENVAIRKLASQQPGANASLPSARAVDGNRETYACVGSSLGRWIKVDLGSSYAVSSVKVTINADMYYRLKIEVTDSTERSRITCKDINEHLSETVNKFVCNDGRSIYGSRIIITDTATASTPLYQTNPKDLVFYEIGVYVDKGDNVGCDIPDSPLNGRWDGSLYQCDQGYTMKGSNANRCIRGVWSAQPPLCQYTAETSSPLTDRAQGCGSPGVSLGGSATRIHQNLTRYGCQIGSMLVGVSERICQSSGSWWPTSLPKCVGNIASNGKVYKSDLTADTKSVDGDPVTCTAVQPSGGALRGFSKRWWMVDLGVAKDITNVTILLQSGGPYSLNVSIGTFVRLDSPQGMLSSFCHIEGNTATAALSCRSQNRAQARYILIEMADMYGNRAIPFTLCEVQVFNYFDPDQCGKPDEPSNGVAINRSSTGMVKFQYQCNSGYKLTGSTETKCTSGQWDKVAPVCLGGSSSIAPTSRPTTARYWPTTDPRSRNPTEGTPSTDTKEKDNYYAGIIGIAVGATVASVSIVLAIIIVVCLLKKHLFKHPNFNQGPVGYNRENSNSTSTTYRPPDLSSLRSAGNSNDYDYAAQHHVYDVIKPLEELLPGRYLDASGEVTVANDAYVNNSPSLNANRNHQRQPPLEHVRYVPPRRQTPLYDVVTSEELQPLTNKTLPLPPPPPLGLPVAPPVVHSRDYIAGGSTPSTAGTLRLTPQTTL